MGFRRAGELRQAGRRDALSAASGSPRPRGAGRLGALRAAPAAQDRGWRELAGAAAAGAAAGGAGG